MSAVAASSHSTGEEYKGSSLGGAEQVCELFRAVTMLFSRAIEQLNGSVADAAYGGEAAITASSTEHKKLVAAAPILDIVAASINTAYVVVVTTSIIKAAHTYFSLREKEGLSDRESIALEEAKRLLGDKSHLIDSFSNGLASLSYLAGSIYVFVATGPLGSVFGSIAFGVFYTANKVNALYSDVKSLQALNEEISSLKETINKESSEDAVKILASRVKILSKRRDEALFKTVQDSVGILVGTSAIVAGVTAIFFSSVASYGALPLAITLGGSIALQATSFAVERFGGSKAVDSLVADIKLSLQEAKVKILYVTEGTREENEVKKYEEALATSHDAELMKLLDIDKESLEKLLSIKATTGNLNLQTAEEVKKYLLA